MKLSPNSWIAGHARSMTLYAIQTSSTVAASDAATEMPWKSDVPEPDAATPEIALRRRGVVRGGRHPAEPVLPYDWIFLISR